MLSVSAQAVILYYKKLVTTCAKKMDAYTYAAEMAYNSVDSTRKWVKIGNDYGRDGLESAEYWKCRAVTHYNPGQA